MSMNGAEGGQGLDAAAKYVADALGQVHARKEELAGALELVRQEERRLATALRALAPDHPLVGAVPGPKPKGKGGGSAYQRIHPDALDRLAAWIRERGDEAFSTADVHADLHGPNSDHWRRGLYWLREHQVIRAAGKKKRADGKGQPAQTYRVMDLDRLDQVLAENRQNYSGPNLKPSARRG
jgi:hypothetical protein